MVFDYFAPVRGLVGGALIGLSAATLLLFNGDILGASGIMSSFIVAPKATLLDPKHHWKLLFIVVFFLTSRIYLLIDPAALVDTRSGVDPEIPIASPMAFVIGGFLVGFGTRLGNGCTTGHGICGLARMSVRSFASVGSFMFSGVLFASTLPVENALLRDTPDSWEEYEPTQTTTIIVSLIVAAVAVFALHGFVPKRRNQSNDAAATDEHAKSNTALYLAASVMSAIFFAVGLIVAQMTLFSRIFSFLDVTLIPSGVWDPTLICVMGGGFAVSFVSYQWVKGFNLIKNSKALECPLSQDSTTGKFNIPTNKIIDSKLLLGEIIFGLGWATAGLCPGPAMVLGASGYPNVLLRWWPMFFVGAFLAEQLKALMSRHAPDMKEVSPVDCVQNNKIEDCTEKTMPNQDEAADGFDENQEADKETQESGIDVV